jgi:hypothetical protein
MLQTYASWAVRATSVGLGKITPVRNSSVGYLGISDNGLRDPDDSRNGIGLERAVVSAYGRRRNLEDLSKKWKPISFSGMRSLGNQQL